MGSILTADAVVIIGQRDPKFAGHFPVAANFGHVLS